MPEYNKDKTLLDNRRTDINFKKADIKSVLPEYFQEDYPLLITLLEKYYEFMDSSGGSTDLINKLYTLKDATSTPASQLENLEDEYLLGTAYFQGFQNKREAIKFSNLLYRSKGTKYSIEQFFRGFYGIDPLISYPKANIFKVGPVIDFELDSANLGGEQIREPASKIGSESLKFLTNDELYQALSILIKTDLPIGVWRDVYKLFVHPAGMFLGSELVITAVNETGLTIIQDQAGSGIDQAIGTSAEAILTVNAVGDITLINKDDYTDSNLYRQVTRQTIDQLQDITISELTTGQTSLNQLLTPNSITFDESDGGASIRDHSLMSDTYYDSDTTAYAGIFTFDQHKYDTSFDSSI